ncbi:MAG TPA: GNAT family N-acetyltransferase [Anaerolineae bacterium]|nr:GNAT family N-acetyltransferase [Anaerolineae bacterium]
MDDQDVAALERANYASMSGLVAATPGSDLLVRDDVTLIRSLLFPMADMNHACLLCPSPERAEPLLDEIIRYFRRRRLPVNVCLSPACSPADLPERLLSRGFRRREPPEAWLTLDLYPDWQPPPLASAGVACRRVGEGNARGFARVYLAAFGLPALLAPVAALLLRRSLRLPSMHYYVALVEDRPAGVCLWHCHGEIACLGAVGVLPAYRGHRVATSVVIRAAEEAAQQGMGLMMTQTLHPRLADVLQGHGFRQAFVRTYYAL